MVLGGKVVAVITTLLAAFFAVYTNQVNSPTVLSSIAATAFEVGDDPDFCPVSADQSNPSSCSEGASNTMVKKLKLIKVHIDGNVYKNF